MTCSRLAKRWQALQGIVTSMLCTAQSVPMLLPTCLQTFERNLLQEACFGLLMMLMLQLTMLCLHASFLLAICIHNVDTSCCSCCSQRQPGQVEQDHNAPDDEEDEDDDQMFTRKPFTRTMQKQERDALQKWVQCAKCAKWRKVRAKCLGTASAAF